MLLDQDPQRDTGQPAGVFAALTHAVTVRPITATKIIIDHTMLSLVQPSGDRKVRGKSLRDKRCAALSPANPEPQWTAYF